MLQVKNKNLKPMRNRCRCASSEGLINKISIHLAKEKCSSLYLFEFSYLLLPPPLLGEAQLTRFELSTLWNTSCPHRHICIMGKHWCVCVCLHVYVCVCGRACVTWIADCRLVCYLNILTFVFCQDNLWHYGHGLNWPFLFNLLI